MHELKIDGTKIKTPHRFTTNRYNLTKAGRVANGDMKMDLIAKKREFNIGYDVISGTELKQILDIIDTDEVFFELEYVESGIRKSATVYPGAIPSDRFRGGEPSSREWYYQNVDFNLIEQ